MSTLLAPLGAFSYRRPLIVLASWLAVLLTVIGLVLASDGRIQASVTVDGTPAQEQLDEIRREMPEAGGSQGSIVYQAQDGTALDAEDRAAIARAVQATAELEYVVDRAEVMARQQADLEAEATERAFAQAEEQVDGQLKEMRQALSDLPTQPGPQQDQLAGIRAALDDALAAQGEEKFTRVAQLADQFASLGTADPASARALRNAAGEDTFAALTSGGDRTTQIRQQAAQQVEIMNAELAQLQLGVAPKGVPLVVDGAAVPGVTLSGDGTVAVHDLQLTGQLDELPPEVGEQLALLARENVEDAGLNAYPSSSLTPMEPPVGGQEIVGLVVAAVVLFLTLGSLIAAGLPLLTAVVGVAVGVGGAFGFSEFYPMTSTTPVLALMLGLAVGIDYALFILHKQRSLILREGLPAEAATARAVGTSGSAVLFAGLTVIIALLGLLLLDISFVATMALAAAATIAVAVLISLTALPALLGLVGERIVSRKARERQTATAGEGKGLSARWARGITGKPWLVVAGVAIALGMLALPAADMRLGMPSGATAAAGSPERLNYDLTVAGLGEGANGPLLVAVDRPAGQPDVERIRGTMTALGDIPGVADAAFRGANADGTLEMYALVPGSGPMAEETEDLVHRLREPGAVEGVGELGVTGLTAINIDLSQKLADAVPVYLAVVAGLSLVILLLVFRSVVIPVAATLGFLLTVGATFGITTSVFGTGTLGWLAGVDRPGTVLSFLPIMATGILYGLAMDYQLFLGTAMREAHMHGAPPRESVVRGFTHASRVVVAAAVIMVSVFGVFVLTDDMMIRQFGFTLAVGILIDAFLIRMALIPALMGVAGGVTWWLPRWLDKVLPRLDVEGTSLERSGQGPADSQPAV